MRLWAAPQLEVERTPDESPTEPRAPRKLKLIGEEEKDDDDNPLKDLFGRFSR